ncbi:hypothetical protein BOO35_19340 [Vibrio navarrensis]|uniref:glycosyltransferase family 2 protein n=1 Tax=Vibrio navarrensis TaxID=29495 RepID=UPI0018685136|nr:glycosyltransferase family 2 protein [Vibrio navarrensis]MBE3667213.1 hypothetical protein [Vibrio navarrensis]
MELVSVYITTHNRAGLLVRAVKSVLNQTYKNVEIIISDDGSSDDTKQKVLDLQKKHKNIVYVRNEVPKGANNARNNALRVANGKYISGLDDDDVFSKDRIEKFVTDWDDKYSFICGNMLMINQPHQKKLFNIPKSGQVCNYRHLLVNNCVGNQIFTLKANFEKIDGFNENLKKFQDWDCWLRMSKKCGPFKRLPHDTYLMYDDASSRVSNNLTNYQAFGELIKHNLDIYDNHSIKLLDVFVLKRSSVSILSFRDCYKTRIMISPLLRMIASHMIKSKLLRGK